MNDKVTRYTKNCLGALIVIGVLISFYAPYWNRSIGYKGGPPIFTAYAWMLLHDLLPYKDYYCPAPLFHNFWSAAIMQWSGDHFIALRFFSVIERLAAGLLIYILLNRLFSIRAAALTAILTIILSSMDFADGLDCYSQHAILFTLFATLAASYAVDANRSQKTIFILGAIAGFFSSLALFTKQSVGSGFTIIFPIASTACIYKMRGRLPALSLFSSYVLGWCLLTALFFGWMYQHGIASDFIRQAYIDGPKAKSLSTFILRLINDNKMFWYAVVIAVFGLVVTWKKFRRSELSDAIPLTSYRELLAIFFIGLASTMLAQVFVQTAASHATTVPDFLVTVLHSGCRKALIFYTFYGLIVYCSLSLRHLFKPECSWRVAQYSLIAAVSLSDSATVCLSYPFYEVMLIPGASLAIAAVSENLKGWKGLTLLAIWVWLIFGALTSRLYIPYSFEGYCESPVLEANRKSRLPQLDGFLLPKDMVEFLDNTVELIHKNSKPNETVFSYPDGALIYPLSDRRPATFSMSLNMDTTSDEMMEKDAQRLLDNPPKVIVYSKIAADDLLIYEKIWRQGKPSGNRKVMEAVEKLAPGYKKVGEFEWGLGKYHFYVYAAPTPQSYNSNSVLR